VLAAPIRRVGEEDQQIGEAAGEALGDEWGFEVGVEADAEPRAAVGDRRARRRRDVGLRRDGDRAVGCD